MQKPSTVALALFLFYLSACTVVRTPEELKQNSVPINFSFHSSVLEAERCLIPELDKLTPFSLPADDTRVPSIRWLGSTLQIIAVDESITLYMIEIEDRAPGSKGTAFVNPGAYKRIIDPQLKSAINKCDGIFT